MYSIVSFVIMACEIAQTDHFFILKIRFFVSPIHSMRVVNEEQIERLHGFPGRLLFSQGDKIPRAHIQHYGT